MARVRLILVGGFLGAGKTTLLARAAGLLSAQGLRIGLITNDQAPNLADTKLLERHGFAVGEVSGGCFCCNFDAFIKALEQTQAEVLPEVIISEPVGSCTDISATVVQPIKKYHAARFDLDPFTVLADPHRLMDFLDKNEISGFPHSVVYIFQKQLEEADVVVINKADLLAPAEMEALVEKFQAAFPNKPVLSMGAQSGHGVEPWLDYLAESTDSGGTITEVDYDLYADGEAALGWLNAEVDLQARGEADWTSFCSTLMSAMQTKLADRAAEVAHLKIHLKAGDAYLQANLTAGEGQVEVQVHGEAQVPSTPTAHLVINARCHLAPDELRTVVEQSLKHASGTAITATIKGLDSFRPGRPEPTHRFDAPV